VKPRIKGGSGGDLTAKGELGKEKSGGRTFRFSECCWVVGNHTSKLGGDCQNGVRMGRSVSAGRASGVR